MGRDTPSYNLAKSFTRNMHNQLIHPLKTKLSCLDANLWGNGKQNMAQLFIVNLKKNTTVHEITVAQPLNPQIWSAKLSDILHVPTSKER